VRWTGVFPQRTEERWSHTYSIVAHDAATGSRLGAVSRGTTCLQIGSSRNSVWKDGRASSSLPAALIHRICEIE
jgi:hypothetical protein